MLDGNDHELDWRNLPPADQQPIYKDEALLGAIVRQIHSMGGLITTGSYRELKSNLAAASRGKAFAVQGGFCANTLDETAYVWSLLVKVITQIAALIAWIAGIRVFMTLRAGSWGKPRSKPAEEKNGQSLEPWRGEAANRREFTPEAREPDPSRLLLCYLGSKAMLSHVGRITHEANAATINEWLLEVIRKGPQGSSYDQDVVGIENLRPAMLPLASMTTGHEGLILPWLEALTFDTEYLGCEFPWIGERTRSLNKAHIRIFSHFRNPIGIKVSRQTTTDEIVEYCRLVNPEPGQLTFIARMGAENIGHLIHLVRAVAQAGYQVAWVCDPMHGNTFTVTRGRGRAKREYKTRKMNAIKAEFRGFIRTFIQAQQEGLDVYPAGVMLELTGEKDVCECQGGPARITPAMFEHNYKTPCDPCLNWMQSIEMGYFIGRQLRLFKRRLNRANVTVAA